MREKEADSYNHRKHWKIEIEIVRDYFETDITCLVVTSCCHCIWQFWGKDIFVCAVGRRRPVGMSQYANEEQFWRWLPCRAIDKSLSTTEKETKYYVWTIAWGIFTRM